MNPYFNLCNFSAELSDMLAAFSLATDPVVQDEHENDELFPVADDQTSARKKRAVDDVQETVCLRKGISGNSF